MDIIIHQIVEWIPIRLLLIIDIRIIMGLMLQELMDIIIIYQL